MRRLKNKMSLPSPALNDKGQTIADATGNEVHDYFSENTQGNELTQEKKDRDERVPFKERVIGVAQKTRGTLLGNQDLKRHGEQILEGTTSHEKDRLQ